MKSEIFFGFLLAMATPTFAQVARNSPCPNYTTPSDYNVNDFAGRWYEFAKTPRLLEPFTKCAFFEYSSLRNGKIEIVTNQREPFVSFYLKKKVYVTPTQSGAWKSISGYEHRVFATDNKRFAVIHACSNGFGLGASEIIWILTRDRNPDYATVFEAQYYVYFEMERYKLSDLKLEDQENCPVQEDALYG